jgi:uncharacterized protein (UPF0333 family)
MKHALVLFSVVVLVLVIAAVYVTITAAEAAQKQANIDNFGQMQSDASEGFLSRLLAQNSAECWSQVGLPREFQSPQCVAKGTVTIGPGIFAGMFK